MLSAGSRLGAYEIVGPLGAGGMGEVYRARDPRLDRDVAIKVLATSLAADPDALARFEREATSIAKLSHPNVLSVFEFGRDDGIAFVVTELVDGETLRARLENGPLPARRAVAYALQIARGIAAAHARGLVHRDLKPENVMITRDDQVKILDFGLAKPVDSGAAELTRAAPMATRAGVVVGTFAYMAPEQVRGLAVDHRADMFAFGVVLYEMLTGQRPFQAETAADTMSAILTNDPPDLDAAGRTIPPGLERIVRRCLEKLAELRFQSATDLAFALESLTSVSSASAAAAPVTSGRNRRAFAAWGIAALSIAGLVTAAVWLSRSRVESHAYAFTIPRSDAGYLLSSAAAVSPDGRLLGFTAQPAPNLPDKLFVRRIDSFDARPLEGTDRASMFAWSLDSRSIVFFAEKKLRIVEIDGPARDVIETEKPVGIAMSREGVILIGSGSTGIRRVSATGGAIETITSPDTGRHEIWHGGPVFLPDGKRFLYISFVRDPAKREQPHYLYAGSLESKQSKLIAEIPSAVAFVPPDSLLFVRDGTVMSVRLDPSSMAMAGDPRAIADGVQFFKPIGGAEFSASENGVLTYRPPLRGQSLAWVDPSGRLAGTIGPVGAFDGGFAFLPDGTEVVAAMTDPRIGTPDLWLYGTRRPTATRLTSGGGFEATPVITPDGKRLFFASDAIGVPDIFVKEIGAAEDPRPFITGPGEQYPQDVSPDGRFLLYKTNDYTGNGFDLYMAPTDDPGKRTPLVRTPFAESSASFSPDGTRIAYQSDETGNLQVYVRPFPGPGRARQVSTAGGEEPRWAPDGKQLYFRDGDRIFVADMSAGEHEPRLLFESRRRLAAFRVAPDGQKFLMNLIDPVALEVPTRVLVNWMEFTSGQKQGRFKE